MRHEQSIMNIGQTFDRQIMPQIEDIDAFKRYVESQNIKTHKKMIEPSDLKSSQQNYDKDKVQSLIDNPSNKMIVVSNDDHVMDGHHRWLANQEMNRKCLALRVDLPILELIKTAKDYNNQLNEEFHDHGELNHEKFGPMLDAFVQFASKKLGIKSQPSLKLEKEPMKSSFGGYSPSDNSIVVITKNRHPMDIYRTVAHELVHHKQNEDGRLGKDIAKEGSTGSDWENEANAEAGKIMRWFAKSNPNMFSSSYVTEEINMKEEKKNTIKACWKGYQAIGFKKKNDKRVPNCVPVDEAFENFIKENKPSDREWGKPSLTKIYAEGTPRQSKKKLKRITTEDNNIPPGTLPVQDGIGPEFTRRTSPSYIGFAGIQESVEKWANDAKTQDRFIEKYGSLAEQKLYDAAKRLNNLEFDVSSKKFFSHLREAWEAKAGRDMGTVPNTGKEEMTEEDNVVDLSQKRDDKNLRNFHKKFMGDVADRANETTKLIASHREKGKLPFEVGSRFSTDHSRRNKLPPMKVTGYYVNPKNPDNDYGYHVERRTGAGEDDVEKTTIALRHPGLEKHHGPEKWSKLVSGFQPVGKLKSIKESKRVDEDWQKVNRKDKTDGLSQKAVNAYRKENPGSKLQTAVTEKNPKGKRAKRRLSFCRRMSGMKKRLTSAETARDPDSKINKALRRWNCEE